MAILAIMGLVVVFPWGRDREMRNWRRKQRQRGIMTDEDDSETGLRDDR